MLASASENSRQSNSVGLSSIETYVAQMQIAVTAPHFARRATCFQQSAGAR